LGYEIDLEDWRWRAVALELASDIGKKILAILQEKPMSATEISRELRLPLTTVFYHLSRLEFLGIIESEIKFTDKGPRWIKHYRASYSKVTFNLGGE